MGELSLFIVKGEVHRTGYMNEPVRLFEDLKLVRARDAAEAGKKFERYWQDQTEEYRSYCMVLSAEVGETIE